MYISTHISLSLSLSGFMFCLSVSRLKLVLKPKAWSSACGASWQRPGAEAWTAPFSFESI